MLEGCLLLVDVTVWTVRKHRTRHRTGLDVIDVPASNLVDDADDETFMEAGERWRFETLIAKPVDARLKLN